MEQGKGYIEFKQAGYAKKILEKTRMAECNPTKYPMDPNEHINKDEGGRAIDTNKYKSLIVRLHYHVPTWPEILILLES